MIGIRLRLLAAVCGMGCLALAGQPGPQSAAAEDKPQGEGEYGTITGQFLMEGMIPRLEPLVAAGNMNVKDPAICAAADIPDDSLIVDRETNGIANIFVFLQKAEKVHPRLKASPVKEVTFDQKGCQFIPHALFVRTDQVVNVKSSDGCAHNIKTNTVRNEKINYLLEANDRAGRVVKNKAPEKQPIKVECNIHRWMTAHWLILDHPYAAVSDKHGKFTIADLPAGEHEFVYWQERVGYLEAGEKERKHKIKVIAGKATDLGTIKVPVEKLMEKR